MEWREHITSDNNILLGKPTVKGTRVSVEHIIGLLAQGWTEQQILENYPRLTHESLQAASKGPCRTNDKSGFRDAETSEPI